MKQLYKFLLVLIFGTGLSLAQAGMGRPPQTTPPTFPSQQQQPGAQHFPDENAPMGQVGTNSTTPATKAATDIQTALKRHMPAAADNVTVSVTNDNKIQLKGVVNRAFAHFPRN